MNYNHKNICSVIVTYEFNVLKFIKILKYHHLNFNKVIIVNNSPELHIDVSFNNVIIIPNLSNEGLSKALNIGINHAKNLGYSLVALFDQDTELPINFSSKMIKYINDYDGNKPAAIYAPIFKNILTKKLSKPPYLKKFYLDRIDVKNQNYLFPTYVITSGSIIPISVIDKVGYMCEELFIDLIDTEWCLRARYMNYEVVLLPKMVINHHLGDYSIKFRGIYFPIHNSLRLYYFFRNSLYLYHLKHINLNWIVVDFTRNLLRFLFYLLFVKNRLNNLKYIFKGYYHGAIKKMGKFAEKKK